MRRARSGAIGASRKAPGPLRLHGQRGAGRDHMRLDQRAERGLHACRTLQGRAVRDALAVAVMHYLALLVKAAQGGAVRLDRQASPMAERVPACEDASRMRHATDDASWQGSNRLGCSGSQRALKAKGLQNDVSAAQVR